MEHTENNTSWKQLMGMGNNLFSKRVKSTTIGLFKYFDEPYLFCASKTAIKRIQIIRKEKGALESFELGIVIGDTPTD